MRAQIIKNSMNAGEVSPYVLARTDLDKYKSALERCENFIPLKTGGVTRRPGMRFVIQALGSSRLLPFEFSSTQTFILEFGNQQLRFFTLDPTTGLPGVILSGGNPYVVATPYDTSVDDLWDLKFTQQADVMWITHPNHRPRKLERITDTNWMLIQPSFNSPPTHAFDQDISAGSITLTPGATAGSGITFTASSSVFLNGDVGKFIIESDGLGAGIAIITAQSGATATADIVNPFASTAPIPATKWLLRGPPQGYLDYMTIGGSNQVHLSRKLGPGQQRDVYTFVDYATDGDTLPNPANCFRSIDLGRYVVAGGSVGKIVQVVTANHVIVQSYSAIEDTIETVANPTTGANSHIVAAPISGGAWTVEDDVFSGSKGFPTAVGFMQDRLFFAGTAALPLQVWGSRTGDYENFAKGAHDDDGLDFAINSPSQSPIRSVLEFRGNLGIFTTREEFMAGGGVISINAQSPQALTPSNTTAVRQSRNGSSRVQPLIVQNMLIYIWRSKLSAAEVSYNIYQANFGSRNLNILHELITEGGIKEMTYQQYPFFVIWYTTQK